MTATNSTQSDRAAVTVRVGVPLAVSLGVVVALLVAAIIGLQVDSITSALYGSTISEGAGNMPQAWYNVLGVTQAVVIDFVTRALPVGIGIFVTLRWITPLTAGLALRIVVVRSVIAALIGIAAAFVFLSLYGVLQQFDVNGPLFGNAFPQVSASGNNLIYGLIGAASSAVSLLVQVLPLTLLAGILTWMWLELHAGQESTRDTRDHV